MATETVFFFGSLTMFALGFLSVVFALFFRRRLRRVNRVVGDPAVSVFDHTFNIFDPYPESRRVIDSLIVAVPFIGAVGMGLAVFVFFEILANGLLLSVVLAVISLNLLFVEGASDAYHNATVFLNSQTKNMGFGQGDLRVLRMVKNALSWLSNYYLGLAAAFIIFGLVLFSLASLFLASFTWVTEGLFKAASVFGPLSPLATALLWSAAITAMAVLVRAMKNRFLRSVFAYPA